MSLSNIVTAYPITEEGSTRHYAVAWCGNAEHQHSAEVRNCPWHVDGDHYSTNTIDTAYTATGGS